MPVARARAAPVSRQSCKANAHRMQGYRGLLPDARLAQSVERKALNLVVVGSSPTVGVIESYINNLRGGPQNEKYQNLPSG